VPVQPEGRDHQEGQAIHVHGMNSHALVGISMVAMDFGSSSFFIHSTGLHLSDVIVQPPTEPPRISA
jgi:hypothetical protein